MNTSEFWSGDFGDSYLSRNRVDWRTRAPFWQQIMDLTKAKEVLEFGCNAGHNLRAIRACSAARVVGVDVNALALEEAKKHGLQANQGDVLTRPTELFDLTFSAGLLIHIAPEDIEQAMEHIAMASKRYVLAVEYESEKEEMVEYRGNQDKLWKRPYGEMYQAMGLRPVKGGEAQGFDMAQFWLLEKV